MRSPSDSSSEDRSLPTRNVSERLAGRALREGIGLPLTAMRVSMETLCDRLTAGTQDERISRSLLSSLTRISDDLDTIVEFLSTPTPRPLSCSVDEILRSARSRLGQRGSSLQVACACAPDTLLVDGPLLVRLLTRLLGDALEDSADPILLSVRETQSELLFAVVHSAGCEAPRSNSALRRVALRLARHEAELLGAEFGVQSGVGEQVVTLLALPLELACRGGIAA